MSESSLSGKSFVVQLTLNWQCLVFCRRWKTPYGCNRLDSRNRIFTFLLCESKRIVHTNGTRSLLDAGYVLTLPCPRSLVCSHASFKEERLRFVCY